MRTFEKKGKIKIHQLDSEIKKSEKSKYTNIPKCHFLTMEDTLDLVEQANQLIREHEFTASIMEESCEGDYDLVEQVYQYIAAGTCPIGCSQNKKRIIRKKSKRFMIKDGELLYLEKRKRGIRE